MIPPNVVFLYKSLGSEGPPACSILRLLSPGYLWGQASGGVAVAIGGVRGD